MRDLVPPPFVTRARPAVVTMALVPVGLFLLFGVWAFLKPPLQSPDEGHHLARALAVPAHPWLARGERVLIGRETLTPLVLSPPPPSLARLFFRRDHHLDAAGVEALRALPWPDAASPAARVEVFTQAWTYPAPYYLALFALGQGATRLLGLEPHASFFAYRLASAALAALLWAWVWTRLRQASQLDAWRPALVAACVANPMLAFLTSSVNPDAVLAPLGALALLATLEVAESGTRVRSALVILVLTALAKPTALLLLASLAGVAVVAKLLPAWRPPHATRALGVIVLSGLAAALLFYAWLPPRTYSAAGAVGPDAIGVVRWLWRVWKSYWGTPGYLDYWLPNAWYLALTAVWLVSAVVAARDWRGEAAPTRRSVLFVASVGALYALILLGGPLAWVPGLGGGVQGRYLLPVSLALALVVVHRRRFVGRAFIGVLGLFHLALAHETVVRYFGGDYGLLWRSLPWR